MHCDHTPMRYWVFYISDDHTKPDQATGWIRAETADAALALVNHPDANVVEVPDDLGFPAEASGPIFWAAPLSSHS